MFRSVLLLTLATISGSEWLNKVSRATTASVVYNRLVGVATDSQGNLFIGGSCSGDPCVLYDASTGRPGANLTGFQFSDGGFIAKYYCNGSIAWRLRIDGGTFEYVAALAVNSKGDPVVVIPFNSMSVNIFDANDNLVSTYIRSSPWTGLIASFSGTNGSFQWGVRMTNLLGNQTFDYFTSVSTGPRDEVTAAGTFRTTSPLGIYNPNGALASTLSSFGSYDILVARFHRNGTFMWATQIGSPNQDNEAVISVDSNGDVFCLGTLAGAFSIYEYLGRMVPGPSIEPWSSVLIKLSGTNGSFLWGTEVLNSNGAERSYSVAVDGNNNVITCGSVPTAGSIGVRDISGSTIQATLIYGTLEGGFLIKYNQQGRYQWAAMFDGADLDRCVSVTVDEEDNVIALGYSNSYPVSIKDAQNQVLQRLECQGFAAFVVKFNRFGTLLWATKIDGQIDETPSSITTDRNGNIYAGGVTNSPSISLYDARKKIFQTLFMAGSPDTWFLKMTKNGSTYGDVIITTKTADAQLTIGAPTIVGITTESIVVNQDNVDPSTQTLQNLYLLIGILAGTLILVITVTQFTRVLLRRQKRLKTESMSTKAGTSSMTDLLSLPSTSGPSAVASSMMTAIMSNHELSIPAFLLMEYGLDFRQGKFIAKGGEGSLYTCSWLNLELAELCSMQPLVIKMVAPNGIDSLTERKKAAFFQEIAIMHRFRDHPLFCKIYAYSLHPATMVMKYYEFGDFQAYINGKSRACQVFPYTKAQITRLFRLICSAVLFMHSAGLAHCDIKPANTLLHQVLIDEVATLIPVLSDFGISRVVSSDALKVQAFVPSDLIGASLAFAGPEVLERFMTRHKEPNPRVWFAGDTYGLAITLYELVVRKHAWGGKR